MKINITVLLLIAFSATEVKAQDALKVSMSMPKDAIEQWCSDYINYITTKFHQQDKSKANAKHRHISSGMYAIMTEEHCKWDFYHMTANLPFAIYYNIDYHKQEPLEYLTSSKTDDAVSKSIQIRAPNF